MVHREATFHGLQHALYTNYGIHRYTSTVYYYGYRIIWILTLDDQQPIIRLTEILNTVSCTLKVLSNQKNEYR